MRMRLLLAVPLAVIGLSTLALRSLADDSGPGAEAPSPTLSCAAGEFIVKEIHDFPAPPGESSSRAALTAYLTEERSHLADRFALVSQTPGRDVYGYEHSGETKILVSVSEVWPAQWTVAGVDACDSVLAAGGAPEPET